MSVRTVIVASSAVTIVTRYDDPHISFCHIDIEPGHPTILQMWQCNSQRSDQVIPTILPCLQSYMYRLESQRLA